MAKYSCSDEEMERRFDEILSKLPKDFIIKWVEKFSIIEMGEQSMKQDNVNEMMPVVSPEEFLELFSTDELFTMGKEMGLIDDGIQITK